MSANAGARVRTLREAHEVLHREWPGHDAPGSAWLAHHQRAADLYADVAAIDPEHRHEAMYWARQERDAAKAVAERMAHRLGPESRQAQTCQFIPSQLQPQFSPDSKE
jgi:hypothetical protein